MEAVIATVSETSGNVYARASDGSLRVVQSGDVLFAGETIVTENGANATLNFGDNESVQLGDNQELLLPENLLSNSEVSAGDNEIIDPSVEAVLAALEGDGDLLEDLEAPAAGTEGAPEGGGGTFVQLTRIVESVDPLAFQFEQQFLSAFEAPIGEQTTDTADAEEATDPETPPEELSPPSLVIGGVSLPSVSPGMTASTANGVVNPDLFEQGKIYNLVMGQNAQFQTKSALQIETELGLQQGALSQFNPDPAPGGVEHLSNILAWEGSYASSQVNIPVGLDGTNFTIGFDWTFYNGENDAFEVEVGYNDFIALKITKPDGEVLPLQLITSSEQANLAAVVNGLFTSDVFDQSGQYQFDWILMDGEDNTKDSIIHVSPPKVSLDGTNFFGLPLALDIDVTPPSSEPGQELLITISNVPNGSIFNQGQELSVGVWEFSPEQLDNLLWFPSADFSGNVEFAVEAVISAPGLGSVSSGSQVLDFTIVASDTVNVDDDSSDSVHSATFVEDFMFGGLGADTFEWTTSSLFPAPGTPAHTDVVGDFSLGEFGVEPNADRLDIKDLLSFNSVDDDILDFVSVEQVGADARLSISNEGNGNINQIIELRNVDLTTLGSDQAEIIDQLVQQGNLLVE